MKIVMRTVLARFELRPAGDRPERARRRSITISPAGGGRVIFSERVAAEPDRREPAAVLA
jgi:hypothetical protein